jgi:hypothetical protein
MKAARALLAVLMLAGCSQPAAPSSADIAAAREMRTVAPLKMQYKPVITGIDVHGTTLDIFVDRELMSEMDGPVEQAMEDQALKRWRDAWKSNNPGKHATLHVRFRNYFGEDVFSESAKV